MSGQVMALGWYVRFVPVSMMPTMDDYYANVIGLPRPLKWRKDHGDPENKDYFWGGEAIILDHNYGGLVTGVSDWDGDPDAARQVQIFRVEPLDTVVECLVKAGADVVSPRSCLHGREAFVRDPMGMLFGLRQREPGSPFPQDKEAARRRLRGEAFNPGCGRMPQGWQEIGWVRLTVADAAAMKTFYLVGLGLALIAEADGCILFDLGDNTTLELAPGGTSRPAPEAQMASLVAMILRVCDLPQAIAGLRAVHAHFVHDIYSSPKGDWTYVSDPEGNVIGIAERKHPSAYVGKLPALPEDLEAQRRWAETTADQPHARTRDTQDSE